MRVFYNAEPFITAKSGIPVYTENLIGNLLELDPDIQLFSGAKSINPQFFFHHEFRIKNRHIKFHFRHILYPTYLPIPPFLSQFLRFNESNYDVVHMLSNIVPASCPFSLHKKLILTIHDVNFFHPEIVQEELHTKGKYILKVQKEHAALARKIITVSEFSKRDIHKYLDVPLDKIHVIPNATQWDDNSAVSPDKMFFEKYSIEPGKFFLSVGAIRRNKNYQALLDGFEKYRKDSRYGKEKLVIVGPNENPQIHAAMQNIPDVILLNHLSSQTLKMLYQNAKGFFLLSLIEGFGIPLLEAMQQGCPACYACGNAMDEIGRDAAFSIENPKDSDAVAEMFARFSFGGPEVQKSVLDCKRIASEYTWRNAASKTLELYKSIM